MTMPTLHLRLLGDFSLLYSDQQVTNLNTTRLRSLLTYLVLHRDVPQQRQHLAFLFWPDATEAQARNNLRQLLHQLRQAFPAVKHFLSADAHLLHWHPVTPFHLDVAEFEQALTLADAATQRNEQHPLQTALEQADSLYRGELLPGCYDEWILPERDRLRQRHLQVLEQLLRLFEVRGDHVTAIRYAKRLIGLDPLSEDLSRRLMRLFALNNDRASALHVYHTCVTTLQRELGVDPDPATREAYERLMQHETPVIPARAQQPLLTATPTLIGRKQEWEALQEVWHAASAGEPRFVLVTGEAGIGKSRLAEEFLLWASQQGAVTAKARSYAAEGQLSLAPVTDWLRSDGLRAPLRQLDAVWLTEVARILPELFAEQPDLPRYESVTEYGQRQRFFEALARAILAASQPLLLLIDDLQWCDQETLEWLHFLLRFDPTARLLVIGCAREEELPQTHPLRTLLLHLRNSMRVTELTLQPLDAAETAKLASKVANRELDMDLVMHLFQETEGYPLFVVEMVRADLGRVSTSPPEADRPPRQPPLDDARTLPPRVHAVLVGRLLQLSASAREFVECAATIGREFTLDLLIAGGLADADSTVGALDELWHKRIVRERGANSYDFTHDKLREVAYGEISAPQRRMLHRRVAQALEAMHAEDLDSVSSQIASHYERAGMIEQALPSYQRAAAVAQRVYANEVTLGGGIGYLSRTLGLTIDNLLSVDMVLADGSFVTASAEEHADLFWAVRGGGGNFGVVTSFLYQLHPISTVYGGPMLWPLEQATDVMTFWRDFILNAPEEINGWFGFVTVPPAPPFPEQFHLQKMCAIVWCYSGALDKADELFKPIRAFRSPAVDFAGPIPWPVLQSLFDALYPPGLQWYWKADFFKDLSEKAIDLHVKYSAQLPTMHSTMHLYPINGAVHRASTSDTAFSFRDANFAEVIVGVDPDPANNERMIQWARDYWMALHPYSAGGGYVNMMMDEGTDNVKAAYRDNYARLAQIKATYDPSNLFHVNQNIKPTR